MTNEIDRHLLRHSDAAITMGAAMGPVSSGCTAPAGAGRIKAPFEVLDTSVPVAGINLMFPVRRTYCIFYSGTRENVGPALRGDVIACRIDGLPDLSAKIVLKKRIGARRFSCRVRRQWRLGRLDAPTLSAERQCRGLPSTSHDMRLISNDRMAR